MTRSVAVTGASGFIGGAVARRLLASGIEVHAFGRRRADRAAREIRSCYRRWDIGRGPLPDPPVVDAVVHCAGAVDDWGRAARFERVNVIGTEHVLASWPEAHVVHVSSSSVYDPDADLGGVSEADADPTDRHAIDRIRWVGHYGRTKRMAEHVVALDRPDRSIILRPRAVYGPGDRTLLPRLLRRYRLGRLVVAGRPETRVSVTHVDNLVSAVEIALASGRTGTYNVADDGPVRLDTLLSHVLTATGRAPRVVFLPIDPVWAFATVAEAVHLHGVLPRPVVTRYQLAQLRRDFWLDTSRAKRELGWRPGVETLDGLRRLREVARVGR